MPKKAADASEIYPDFPENSVHESVMIMYMIMLLNNIIVYILEKFGARNRRTNTSTTIANCTVLLFVPKKSFFNVFMICYLPSNPFGLTISNAKMIT